jgi:ketosteroid isomerase-like protein/L-lactate utilization protein LutC
MSDPRTIADRVEIEALRGEFTDAAMMRDYDRLAALFTDDGALRMPDVPVDLVGPGEIRAWGHRVPELVDLFVQNTHPGTIRLDGDTASGRAYMHELIRLRDGSSHLNHAVYHDRYRRAADGWKFAERVYEIRYLDQSPLAGSGPSRETTPAPTAPPHFTAQVVTAPVFTAPAPAERLERAATALAAHGFAVEILDDVTAARARVAELVPAGAAVFTSASETLRLSGIDEDINGGERYQAIKPRVLAMDRATRADEIRRLLAGPDVVVGSVAAVTETGSIVVASGSGSQIPAYSGGAAQAIWVVGAQKVVPDLATALRRVEDHALPLENARALAVYGQPSAVNRLLVLNAEPHPGRVTVLLLREAIGF